LIVEKNAVPNMMKGKSISLLKNVSSLPLNPRSLKVLYTLKDRKEVRKKLIHKGK